MKPSLVLAGLTLLLLAPARAERIDYLAGLSPADHYELLSEAVGRSYHIFVRLPENYDETRDAYPTVYLLDGDIVFPLIAAYHLFLSYDEPVPDAIIVGISYGTFDRENGNYRGTDYTAPPVPEDYRTGPQAGDANGGAAAFQQFLADELAPMIEDKYRADPDRRIIVGQSRGAHFVLYSALTRPALFWGHIASNPSLQPHVDFFFQDLKAGDAQPSNLFFSSGSRDYPSFREDALKLFDHLHRQDEKPWRLKTVTMKGETHAAGITNVYRAGMKWLFSPDQNESE